MIDHDTYRIVQEVKEKNPLIHHIINDVVINFTANGLLSFGGSPIMAKELEEMHDIAQIADGVLINIGTIRSHDLESILSVCKGANKRHIPVVLDPVGVAATPYRTKLIEQLLKETSFTVIKGNAGEMAHLVNIAWETKGVESIGHDTDQLIHIAEKVANTYQTIAVVTGETDVISDGHIVRTNKTGHYFLTKITGAGCLLGSLITASLTLKDNHLDRVFETVSYYGHTAEIVADRPDVNGPGTFLPHFIDMLGGMEI